MSEEKVAEEVVEQPEQPKKRTRKTACRECGGTELYQEAENSRQWIQGKEIAFVGERYYCLNPECGYTWRK